MANNHTGYEGLTQATDNIGGQLQASLNGNQPIYGFSKVTTSYLGKATENDPSAQEKFGEFQYWENDQQLGQLKSSVSGYNTPGTTQNWYLVLGNGRITQDQFYVCPQATLAKGYIVSGQSFSFVDNNNENRLSTNYTGNSNQAPSSGVTYDELSNCDLRIFGHQTIPFIIVQNVAIKFHCHYCLPKYTLTYDSSVGFQIASATSAIDDGNYFYFKTILTGETSGYYDYYFPALSIYKEIYKFATPSISEVNYSSNEKYASLTTTDTNASNFSFYLDSTTDPIYTGNSKKIVLTNSQYYGLHTIYCKINGTNKPIFVKSVTKRIQGFNQLLFAEEHWTAQTDSDLSIGYQYHKYVDAPSRITFNRIDVDTMSFSWPAVTDASSYAYKIDNGNYITVTGNSVNVTIKDTGPHSFYVKAFCSYSSEYGEAAYTTFPMSKISNPTNLSWSQIDSGSTDYAPDAGTISFTMPDYATEYIIYVDGVKYYDSGS